MYKFSAKGQKWLKIFHLLFVCLWTGGAFALLTLNALRGEATTGDMLAGVNAAFHQVDFLIVVIGGAFGCTLTGLLYSLFTPWGFARHGWIVIKWIATIICILVGTFFLGPWEEGMLALSRSMGLAALSSPEYISMQRGTDWVAPIQTGMWVVLIILSVLKPWPNIRKKKKAPESSHAVTSSRQQ